MIWIVVGAVLLAIVFALSMARAAAIPMPKMPEESKRHAMRDQIRKEGYHV